MSDEVLSLADVADLLSVPLGTVIRWTRRKKNPLPSSMMRIVPSKKSIRVVRRSDALAYERPKMGGAR